MKIFTSAGEPVLGLVLGSLVFFGGCQATHKPGAAANKSVFVGKFSSPQETFETWKYAAQNLDISLLVSTYASSARSSMEDEFKNAAPQEMKQMQDEAKKTKFSIEKVVYEGDRAFLRVKREYKSRWEDEVLTMVREGQEWKILP